MISIFGLSFWPIRGSVFLFLLVISCIPVRHVFPAGEQQPGKAKIHYLPPPPFEGSKPGACEFPGMVAGVHNGVIIAAGGMMSQNDASDSAKALYSNSIFLFQNNKWEEAKAKTPLPVAFSASVSTPGGILVIGGKNAQSYLDHVFMIWIDRGVQVERYPSLPQPLAHVAATVVDDHLYVIGGEDGQNAFNTLYRLDLKQGKTWEKLSPLPGPPRYLASITAQEASDAKKLFVIGGVSARGTPLYDHFSYNLLTGVWEKEKNVEIKGQPQAVYGAVTTATGSMHILVCGAPGRDGFTGESPPATSTKKQRILGSSPGPGGDVLAYNTITKKWFLYDHLPFALSSSTFAFADKEVFYISDANEAQDTLTSYPNGIRAGPGNNAFGILNYSVLVAYLLLSLFIGLYFSKRQRSTADYFKGGGRIPWWASGLSVFGTLLSAITFMAIPSKAFITDWSYFFINIAAILIVPLITLVFIPYFNQLNLSTAYQFLEQRFNYTVRVLGSLSFVLFQLGRIGIILLLPSLAISLVTGVSVEVCVLAMGLLCIVYTTFGGIEAVIWTDVMQVVVLLGGSVLATFWIWDSMDKTPLEIYRLALQQDKFNVFNMEADFSYATFWVVFLGGLASALVNQGTDQTIVQRYLTSADVTNAKKTAYTNAVLTLPATFIFFGLGTLLFVFYSTYPGRLSPYLNNNDSILPWYIVHELPAGVAGLLIAGIFSAAMSSLSSSLNSISTAFCNDFYMKWKAGTADRELLKIGRLATVTVGVIGVMLALWMANSGIKSLWDQFYRFLGFFTGGLGGIFLLGLLNKRCHANGALGGLAASAVTIWWVSTYTSMSFLLYTFIGVITCYVVGSFLSLLTGKYNS